ncbi:ribonuclease S-4-like [Vicia villosa]|uniref:ribonuclease S-4-like n=1 Tax=Vicia villosa TaxID=3911 RepID=UPI00273B311E|nr:ribonuclease S-4-like [Vicia villosa]
MEAPIRSTCSWMLRAILKQRDTVREMQEWKEMEDTDAVEYEYLKLVLQWGPTVCEEHDDRVCVISPIMDKLTVHGLWPATEDEPQPRDCDTEPDGNNLKENGFPPLVVTKMHQFWPSYFEGPVRFWRRQWRRHGRCAYPHIQQIPYVRLATNYAETIDIIEALKEVDIVPRSNREDAKYWSRNLLIDTVTAYGVRKGIAMDNFYPELRCIRDHEFIEARICLSPNGDAIIRCPSEGTCLNKFQLLTYPKECPAPPPSDPSFTLTNFPPLNPNAYWIETCV